MKALPKAEGDKSSADKVDMNLVTDYYRRWLSLTDDPLPTGTLWLQRKSRGYAVWEREREQAEMSGTRFDTPKPCDEKTDFEYVSTLDCEYTVQGKRLGFPAIVSDGISESLAKRGIAHNLLHLFQTLLLICTVVFILTVLMKPSSAWREAR